MGQARCAAAVAGPCRASFAVEAAQRHAIRFPEEPAGAAAEFGQAGRGGSDRRDDRRLGRPRDGHRFRAGAGGPAMTRQRRKEPWRQRLVRGLLYGRDVDRATKARARVGFAILAFVAIYAVIGGRLVMFAMGGDGHGARRTAGQDAIATARPDIVDRNGEVLATDVKAPSLFGEPRRIIDKDEAIELLTATLPDLDTGEVRERLSGRKGFVWLKREITPQQQLEIHRLGITGLGFLRENKRVYPTGHEVAHLIGLVSNLRTGESVAMVSEPDFDPNNRKEAHDPDRINRLTTGVYEMGSTFKAFTLAMALDSGKYDLNSLWDARTPLHYGKFAIHDDEPKGRFLNMKEVFTFSSNVGAARIAL